MCRALVQSFVQTLRTLRPVVSEKKDLYKTCDTGGANRHPGT